MLRDEVRLRKAAELIADAAKPIPLEQAEAREKIWTPDKERPSPRPPSGRGRGGRPLDARRQGLRAAVPAERSIAPFYTLTRR